MKKILIVLAFLIVLIGLSFVVFKLGLYPVAYVEGKFISYTAWQEYLNDLKWQTERAQELQIANVQSLTEEELKKQSLDFLVEKVILEKLAKEKGITITKEEISKYFSEKILPQANNNEEEVKTTLKELFNWSLDDFKTKVLQEYLLREKIQENLGEEDLDTKITELKDQAIIIKFIRQ